MIHYHGLPITPATAAAVALKAGHAFVSYAYPQQLGLAVAACQSFAIDNGAFSAWRSGNPITDWTGYYAFAMAAKRHPSCDFAVIPDVIDGSEADNDNLCADWPFPRWFGAPVWHLHESLERLHRLAIRFPRVCLGSSGDFAVIGTDAWWQRMNLAMRTICTDDGYPMCRIHGLRMLDPRIVSRFPLASADSGNVNRNIGIDSAWRASYQPSSKEGRAWLLRERIESQNAPSTYDFMPRQEGLLI